MVIAGMGEFGTFNEDRLRILMTNVAMGAGALGIKSLATVLVGAGEGNLGLDRVLRGLLNGIGVGLSNLLDETGKSPSLQEVTIVERDAARFLEVTDLVERLSKEDALLSVQLHPTRPTTSELARARKMARSRHEGKRSTLRSRTDGQPQFSEVRITVEAPSEGKDTYRFSAIAPNSVVPVREVEVNADGLLVLQDAVREAARNWPGALQSTV